MLKQSCDLDLAVDDSIVSVLFLFWHGLATPPKKARKFKKPASPQLTTVPVSPEEPIRKSKRIKRPAKKSTKAPTRGAHPSGSGTVTKINSIAVKIKPSVINEGIGVKPGVPDVTEEESTESKAESWGKDKDDSNNKHDSRSEGSSESEQEENEEEVKDDEEEKDEEFVKTPSNSTNDEDETNNESKVQDKVGGDEDEGMDYTTKQFDDDVDLRMNEPVTTDEGFIQKEGTNAEMTNVQQGNENQEITLNQVIEDAHVTLSTVPQKTEVLVISSSHSSDLASKFLNFSDIPHMDAEKFSPMDVHVYHKVPSKQTPTLLIVPVSVITDSSPVYLTVIPQSLQSFTPPPPQSTPTPPPITEAINPPSTLPNFASVFQFDNRVTSLEKEVSTYEAASSLIEFELKKILIDKMDESQSYLTAPEHRECYDGLIMSYDLDKSLFSTYDKVYSLKRSRKDKDKDEDPSAGSDRGLKKRKTSKDAEPTKGPKAKESQSGSSKGAKSQSKSSGKSVQSEEPEFEVADSDMPQDQEENPGNDDEEPKGKVASKRDWFTKPKRPQEPTDPDWNDGKTPQQGPTQSWLMTLASSADKPSKTFDELMSTPIDFSAYIMNGLKISNLTQETLLGPAFKLLKGTRSNYAELEYDFEECYKALSEKLDWNNPEGGDYPFDLTKPLPLVMNGNRQIVLVDYFFNNDLKYLQGGISTITYTTSLTKTKAAQYDLPGIEDMVPNIWSPVKVAYDKHALWGISHWRDQLTRVEVMRKHGYGYLKEIEVRRADNDLYTFKEGNDVSDSAIALRMFTISMVIQTRVEDLQLGVERRNRLMRSDELYKFSDRTLTRLRTSLDDITKNIRIEYLPRRRLSTLEKKRANIIIKAIDKQLKERRMRRSLEKFVGGRHYGIDL
ncbi:hypothetical protein Tco_0671250 [Tanacetum coccineum]